MKFPDQGCCTCFLVAPSHCFFFHLSVSKRSSSQSPRHLTFPTSGRGGLKAALVTLVAILRLAKRADNLKFFHCMVCTVALDRLAMARCPHTGLPSQLAAPLLLSLHPNRCVRCRSARYFRYYNPINWLRVVCRPPKTSKCEFYFFLSLYVFVDVSLMYILSLRRAQSAEMGVRVSINEVERHFRMVI